jgi:hypothetical protein
LDTTIVVFSHLDFVYSFTKYGAWNEIERNTDLVFLVSVHSGHLVIHLKD